MNKKLKRKRYLLWQIGQVKLEARKEKRALKEKQELFLKSLHNEYKNL